MNLFTPPTPDELAAMRVQTARARLTQLRAAGWDVVEDGDAVTFLPRFGAPVASVDIDGERWVYGRCPRYGAGVMVARTSDVRIFNAIVERVDKTFDALGGESAIMKHLAKASDITEDERNALDAVARLGNRLALLEYLASLAGGGHDTNP